MLVEVVISPNDAGQRAERFLRRYLPQLASGRLQSLFRRKEVKVSKKAIEQGYMLVAGDRLQVFGVRDEEAASHDEVRAAAGAPLGSNTVDGNSEVTSETAHNRRNARPSYPLPDIVHEDFELLVVNKPAGLAAHPGSGILPGASLIERARDYLVAAQTKIDGPALTKKQRLRAEEKKWEAEGEAVDAPLEDLLFAGSREGLEPGWGNELFAPSLVHRLDKDTSGLLLIAKTGGTLRELTAALRDGLIRKRYLALVAGRPEPAAGTIDAALERDDAPSGAKSRVTEDGDGKRSVTHYKTIKVLGKKSGKTEAKSAGKTVGKTSAVASAVASGLTGEYSLLQVTIDTGRMHQIRAHLAHIGHPIVGDTRYDKPSAARERLKELGLKRLFLHAEELAWNDNGVKKVFKAPLPEELRAVVGK